MSQNTSRLCWIVYRFFQIYIKHKNFQHVAIVALNHKYEYIGKNSQGISKIKSFISKYNLKAINYPSGKNNWKNFQKNNPTIAYNVLYIKK